MKKSRLAAMALGTAAATLLGLPTSAGAQPFPGFAWVQEPALAFRADISVPDTLPSGSVAQYAWVMGEGGNSFTQVGWAWWPGKAPQVFAYTANMGSGDNGVWALGPQVDLGSTITVQIVRSGDYLEDQFLVNGVWTTVQSALVGSQDEVFTTQMEDYGPSMPTCFTDRGWESAPQVWHHLVSGCFSQS